MTDDGHIRGDGTQDHLDEVEERLLQRRFLHDEPSSYEEGVRDTLALVTDEFVVEDVQEAAEQR